MSKLATASLPNMLRPPSVNPQHVCRELGTKILGSENIVERIMASIKNFFSPVLSNIYILFPNKAPEFEGEHVLQAAKQPEDCCKEYDLKECQKQTRSVPNKDDGPVGVIPSCDSDSAGVHSGMDIAYRKWDCYWPLYKERYQSVKRIENYPAGTDPNSNDKL